MAKFLDNVGLDHFWQELKGRIQLAARGAIDYITDISSSEIQVHPSGDSSAGININSRVSGDTTMVTTASLVTWNTTASVDATTQSVNDENATTGSTVVTATINGTDHALGSTYASVVVNAGIGVDVTLTSSGVTYVRSLMIDDSDPDNIIVSPCSLSVEYMRTVADIVRFTFPGEQIINSIGRAILLRNNRWTSSNKYETFLSVLNEVTNKGVLFGVGSGGQNRGVFDTAKGDWIIYRNEDGKTVINGDNFRVDANGGGYFNGTVWDNYQFLVQGALGDKIALRANTGGTIGLMDVKRNSWLIFRNASGTNRLAGDPWYITDHFDTSNACQLTMPKFDSADGSHSVANDSDTTLGSVTIPAGRWIVSLKVVFPSSTRGRRGFVFHTDKSYTCTPTGANYGYLFQPNEAQSSGWVTFEIAQTTAQKWYIRAYQNSGSSMTVTYGCRYMRQH